MRVQLRTTILLLLLAANASLASSPSVVLEKHRVVIQVNGVVCSFCAYGAEKALAELDCLDKAEFGDGVLIDIDTHRITLAMRPGEAIPFRDIYQRIKKAGYDPITLTAELKVCPVRVEAMKAPLATESRQQ